MSRAREDAAILGAYLAVRREAGVRIPAPGRLYFIEYGTGEPGDPWNRMDSPWRSIRHALAWFSHLTRCNPIDAYRVVTDEGRTVVMMVPGAEAAA